MRNTFSVFYCNHREIFHNLLLEIKSYFSTLVRMSDEGDLSLDIETVSRHHHTTDAAFVARISVLLKSYLTEIFQLFFHTKPFIKLTSTSGQFSLSFHIKKISICGPHWPDRSRQFWLSLNTRYSYITVAGNNVLPSKIPMGSKNGMSLSKYETVTGRYKAVLLQQYLGGVRSHCESDQLQAPPGFVIQASGILPAFPSDSLSKYEGWGQLGNLLVSVKTLQLLHWKLQCGEWWVVSVSHQSLRGYSVWRVLLSVQSLFPPSPPWHRPRWSRSPRSVLFS